MEHGLTVGPTPMLLWTWTHPTSASRDERRTEAQMENSAMLRRIRRHSIPGDGHAPSPCPGERIPPGLPLACSRQIP